MKKIKCKILATILLFSLLINMFSSIIFAYNESNNNANEIENQVNTINNTLKENNSKANNTTENDVAKNNTTKNDIANNTTNNTISNTIGNNTVDNTTNNTTNNTTKKNENNNPAQVEALEAEPFKAKTFKATVSNSIQYKTHVQNVGWQNWKQNGETAGTSGKGLRLEAINIQLVGDIASKVKVKYQVHVQNVGWQGWKQNGELAGTSGRGLRLEAIKIQLETSDDYSVMYRVHVQNVGWQSWKTDGEMAGTSGRGLRLEAIEIKIVPKTKKGLIHIDTPKSGTKFYSPTSIQISGWKMANVSNNKISVYIDNNTTPISESSIVYKKRDDVIKAISGYGSSAENPTPGFEINLNTSSISSGNHTIKVFIISSKGEKIQGYAVNVNIDRGLHVGYKTHVQSVGWQEKIYDGGLAGTSGRGLRLEALNIKLYGAPAGAKIVYRTHVQSIGWQNWVQDGLTAGTVGAGLRIEALQIKLENMDKYTIEYQVHVQNIGWTGWYIDGETAGTVGQGKRIEAIRIRIVPKYKHQYNGIDVSQYNGSVNWGFVKRSGKDFAMIRVGYRGYGQAGNFREDATFRANIQAAKQAGIPVGVYFITQAITPAEAIEEANWVLDKIKGYKLEYPIAIDIEAPGLEKPTDIPRTQNLDKNTRTYLAKLFCQTIQNAGYTPMIYTNVDWAYNKLNMSGLSEYDTWIASYKENISSGPSYNGRYAIWQHTSKGIVDGILGYADLNICYKKY